MSLDSRYINISDLQGLFRDKTTAEPLSGGSVEFYKDVSRNVAKPVFILSGSPPNYTYTNIGNVIDLSAAGTYQYDNQGITPFYFPYDDEGKLDLYYAVIKDSDGVEQFSREAVPYLSDESENNIDYTNFIPNSQFLIHTNIPENKSNNYEAGEIREDITVLTQGGWTFERSTGSTAKDFVLFERFSSISTNPSGYPRYFGQIKCETPNAGDTVKDLRVKFKNVNRFASTTQQYTFAFTAIDNAGASVSVDVYLIKNYGASGSAEEEIKLETETITNSFNVLQTTFIFGTNTDKTLGTDDNDFIQIAIRFPTNAEYDVSITDVVLTPNAVDISIFPTIPNYEQIEKTLAGHIKIPDYDSKNLYLPLVLTPSGIGYDDSRVGTFALSSYESAEVGQLLCRGQKLETAAYSSDGIPYSRLQKKLWDETAKVPLFGTGEDYVTSLRIDGPAMAIGNNQHGTSAFAADGGGGTGFTFLDIHTGAATKFEFESYYVANNVFALYNDSTGAVTPFNAGTSGFTGNVQIDGNTLLKNLIYIQTTAATSLAGKYFQYYTPATAYYIWFKVDNVGVDPAPGGTPILIELSSSDDANTVAKLLHMSLVGGTVSRVLADPASLSGGDYFIFDTTGDNYYVWYKIDGVGVDPNVTGRVGILVEVPASPTVTQVNDATHEEINRKFYQLPYTQSDFIRIWGALESGNLLDSRINYVPGLDETKIGSFQYTQYMQHGHTGSIPNNYGSYQYQDGATGTSLDDATGSAFTWTVQIDDSGGTESRPPNLFLNLFIYY